jgi:hypothetical protein
MTIRGQPRYVGQARGGLVRRSGTAYPWTVTGAWIVYAAWTLAGGVLAVTTITRRDL